MDNYLSRTPLLFVEASTVSSQIGKPGGPPKSLIRVTRDGRFSGTQPDFLRRLSDRIRGGSPREQLPSLYKRRRQAERQQIFSRSRGSGSRDRPLPDTENGSYGIRSGRISRRGNPNKNDKTEIRRSPSTVRPPALRNQRKLFRAPKFWVGPIR